MVLKLTTLQVDDQVHKKLTQLGYKGESYNQILRRLLKLKKDAK